MIKHVLILNIQKINRVKNVFLFLWEISKEMEIFFVTIQKIKSLYNFVNYRLNSNDKYLFPILILLNILLIFLTPFIVLKDCMIFLDWITFLSFLQDYLLSIDSIVWAINTNSHDLFGFKLFWRLSQTLVFSFNYSLLL